MANKCIPESELEAIYDIEKLIGTEIPPVDRVFWEDLAKREGRKNYRRYQIGYVVNEGHIVELGLVYKYFDNEYIHSSVKLMKKKLETLPKSIGMLKNLKKILLMDNNIHTFPETFSNLINLEILNLAGNFSNTLPSFIGFLENLKYLNIKLCGLHEIPESFGRLVNLEKLNINLNHLKTLPESFSNLKKLSILKLYHNEIEYLPKGFGGLIKLKKLEINENKLKSLPQSIGNLQNVEELLFHDNQIRQLPSEFSNNSKLRILDLGDNKLKSLPDNFGNLQSLELLDLSYNNLKKLPDSFQELSNLKLLRLTRNSIINFDEIQMTFGKMEDLSIRGNKLKEFPDFIKNLTHLEKLELSDNIIKSIPDWIGNLTHLKTLVLKYNQITKISNSIIKLKNLEWLNLRGNRIEKLPEYLGGLINLRHLEINVNNFSKLPIQIWELRGLEVIYISEDITIECPLTYDNLADFNETKLKTLKLLDYCKSQTYQIFISHAVVNFTDYDIKSIAEYLEQKADISKVFICERDLKGNIDKFMELNVPKCEIFIFFITNESLESIDCQHELDLAKKYKLVIIPLKSNSVSIENPQKLNLDLKNSIEFPVDFTNDFSENLYLYIKSFKNNLAETKAFHNKINTIYSEFKNKFLKILKSKEFNQYLASNSDFIKKILGDLQIGEIDKFQLFEKIIKSMDG